MTTETVELDALVMPLTAGELKIVYEYGLPYGIRDRNGFLFFFTGVQKFVGQEDRYRREVEHKFRVADFLLHSLQGHNAAAKSPERSDGRT